MKAMSVLKSAIGATLLIACGPPASPSGEVKYSPFEFHPRYNPGTAAPNSIYQKIYERKHRFYIFAIEKAHEGGLVGVKIPREFWGKSIRFTVDVGIKRGAVKLVVDDVGVGTVGEGRVVNEGFQGPVSVTVELPSRPAQIFVAGVECVKDGNRAEFFVSDACIHEHVTFPVKAVKRWGRIKSWGKTHATLDRTKDGSGVIEWVSEVQNHNYKTFHVDPVIWIYDKEGDVLWRSRRTELHVAGNVPVGPVTNEKQGFSENVSKNVMEKAHYMRLHGRAYSNSSPLTSFDAFVRAAEKRTKKLAELRGYVNDLITLPQ